MGILETTCPVFMEPLRLLGCGGKLGLFDIVLGEADVGTGDPEGGVPLLLPET